MDLFWRSLNKKGAIRGDGETVEEYARNLWINISNFEQRLKVKKYKVKLVRRKYIPKDVKGSKLPRLGR